MQIIKKDGRIEQFDFNKIRAAVSKSAARLEIELTDEDFDKIKNGVNSYICDKEELTVAEMHGIVEGVLHYFYPEIGQAYSNYRNYKKDYAEMMTSVLNSADELNYKIDRSNANTTAALISTQRSLIFTALSKEIYKKLFLSREELQAIRDGYIYIHDLGSRAQTYNCCLFDMGAVLQGGFEWEHIGYNEPKDVRTAGNLVSDITLNCAAQQYGGFTIPEIDSILAPYARKTYNKYMREYKEIVYDNMGQYDHDTAHKYSIKRLTRDIEQVFQGFEHTFNTVASSRGDYPFVTMTGGCEEDEFGQLVWKVALQVRRKGQGKPGHRRPAIFPKLVFLYTEQLHGQGQPMHYLFEEAIKTSAIAMYPDYLSLDMPDESLVKDAVAMHFEPGIAKVFHKYHQFGQSRWFLDEHENVKENPEWVDSIISPMGCRAYLSPYYERGELVPADENDKPMFHGRFNGGAISVNLPMIYMQAKQEEKDFFDVLRHYMDMIHRIHIKTFEFLSKLKASCNPVAFCEGGFGYIKPTDNIHEFIRRITFSYGFTALNELQELATGQSLYEVRHDTNSLAFRAEKFISDYVDMRKQERIEGKTPYIAAIYATPAESLCGTQLEQFRAKYGIIEKVSDRAYFTNSFHMWVGEDITPWEKQDAEFNYFHVSSGGHIQYCRFANGQNLKYIQQTVERAMKLGYYFGVNIEKSYCGHCGETVDDGITECPHCGSNDITTINRVCGYLGYSRVDGTSKMNDAKLAEIADRKSM
jgi:ribonucleoside-triphosphate reductase